MSVIKTMTAIEYNTWMSLLWFMRQFGPTISAQYGIDGTLLDVAPSYPKDLTKFRKPSIIVQKIHSNSRSVGMGGALGSYYDAETNSEYDINGNIYKFTYQLDINADGNASCSLLTDMVLDLLTRACDRGENTIKMVLMDFVTDVKNPVPIGDISIGTNRDVTPLSSNDNQDYINALRIELIVIQSIVNNSKMVDLTKPIRLTNRTNQLLQTIRL